MSEETNETELERRLRASGRAATSLACHPGWADTNLATRGPNMEGSSVKAWFAAKANAWFAQTAVKGAEQLAQLKLFD